MGGGGGGEGSGVEGCVGMLMLIIRVRMGFEGCVGLKLSEVG